MVLHIFMEYLVVICVLCISCLIIFTLISEYLQKIYTKFKHYLDEHLLRSKEFYTRE